MKVHTHQMIAKEAYKLISTYLPLQLDEKVICLGASMPDLAPHRRFKAHNIGIAAKEWLHFISFVERRRYTTGMIAYAAGIMSHYISDTFCYAHNFSSLSLRDHRKYEVYMHRYLKENKPHIAVEEVLEKWNMLKEKGIEDYIKGENVYYKKSIKSCEKMKDIMEIDIHEAVVQTAVWMLEIAYVLYPTFMEEAVALS